MTGSSSQVHRLLLGCVLGFCATIAPAAVAAVPAFSELIVFGDSLSDRRNMESLTLGLAPNPPYASGRFSNGPLWVEQLGGHLGLGPVIASRDGGNDFAYGGVTTGDGSTNFALFFNAPNVGQQVLNWTGSRTANDTQLFTILGGGNDFIAAVESGATFNVDTAADAVATNIAISVLRLYIDGARHIMVGNLPDLGRVPRFLGTADQLLASQLSLSFASALDAKLDELSMLDPDLNLYRLDLLTMFDEVLADPSGFGFTNVTNPAWTGDYFGSNGTLVPDPSTYLFFDDIHPTTSAHLLLGDRALMAIPEPTGAIGCVMIVAVALLARRRADQLGRGQA